MIETVTPPPRTPNKLKIAIAGATLIAVVGGALVLAGGNDPGPAKLALATNGGGAGDASAERMAAPTAAAAQDAPGGFASSMIAPAPWGGMEFKVDGDLPELGGQAAAWKVTAQAFDRTRFDAIAAALGVKGEVIRRDGSYVIENANGSSLSAFPSDDGWMVNFYRSIQPETAGTTSGKTISGPEAEQTARDLLDGLDALEGEWAATRYETEFNAGYGCAYPEKMRMLEQEKLAQQSSAGEAASPGTAVSSPAADGDAGNRSSTSSGPTPAIAPAPDCPPPPAPRQGWNISFTPVLGGLRSDWAPWNVSVGADGIENLSGTFSRFEKAGDFETRGTQTALDELKKNSVGGGVPMPMPADDMGTVDVGTGDMGTVEVDPAPAGAVTVASPAMAADIAPTRPVLAPDTPVTDPAYVCPANASCVPPEAEPQVVVITGAERALSAMPVYEKDGRMQMHLVPAYRFTGRFENAETPEMAKWETTMIALHPDAIAPPPVSILYGRDGGAGSKGGGDGVSGIESAIEPAPPVADPAGR